MKDFIFCAVSNFKETLVPTSIILYSICLEYLLPNLMSNSPLLRSVSQSITQKFTFSSRSFIRRLSFFEEHSSSYFQEMSD